MSISVMGVIMSMGGQAMHFGVSVLAGAAIGVLYDCFRVARRVVRHPPWLVHAQDALFWFAATILLFAFMHHMGMGQLRIFILVGAAAGAALYFATASPLFVKAATVSVRFLRRVIIVFIRFIGIPFSWIHGKIRPHAKRCLHMADRCVRIQRKKLAHGWNAVRKKV